MQINSNFEKFVDFSVHRLERFFHIVHPVLHFLQFLCNFSIAVRRFIDHSVIADASREFVPEIVSVFWAGISFPLIIYYSSLVINTNSEKS